MTEFSGPECVIIGAGYVGLATAVAVRNSFAGSSSRVIVTDRNVDRIMDHTNAVCTGVNPLGEPGMALALQGVEFIPAPLLKGAVVFVCVGTPAKGGTIDCSAVREVVLDALDGGAKEVVIRSTVTPSFVAGLLREVSLQTEIRKIGSRTRAERISVVPEFLREGHAVEDAISPSRIVVGSTRGRTASAEVIFGLLFGRQYLKFDDAANDGRATFLRPVEAALVKLASNAMLSVRAWFANAVANACEDLGDASAGAVLTAVGEDPRIGRRHLSPGLGVGGPCLPKDLGALVTDQPSFGALQRIAESMDHDPVDRVADRIRSITNGSETVVISGCGFKPDSCDWRNSPAVALALNLAVDHFVTIVDPRLSGTEHALLSDDLRERCQGECLAPAVFQSFDRVPPGHVLVLCSSDPLPAGVKPTALLVDPYRLNFRPTPAGVRVITRGQADIVTPPA